MTERPETVSHCGYCGRGCGSILTRPVRLAQGFPVAFASCRERHPWSSMSRPLLTVPREGARRPVQPFAGAHLRSPGKGALPPSSSAEEGSLEVTPHGVHCSRCHSELMKFCQRSLALRRAVVSPESRQSRQKKSTPLNVLAEVFPFNESYN